MTFDRPGSRNSGLESRQRLLDLLADRAVFGLEADEQEEVEALMATMPDADHESLDRIAAALAVAMVDPRTAGRPSIRRPAIPRRVAAIAVAATVAAALVVACWPVVSPRGKPAEPRTAAAGGFARAREELLTEADDVIRLDCSSVSAAEAAGARSQQPRGDIVWSPSRQRGFLRIHGLPPNDPRETQYQIWIVVGRRPVPVRGGVFDVLPAAVGDGEEVVVPILPQEVVQGPMMFAVTAEKPGGSSEFSTARAQAVARAD